MQKLTHHKELRGMRNFRDMTKHTYTKGVFSNVLSFQSPCHLFCLLLFLLDLSFKVLSKWNFMKSQKTRRLVNLL